jgi:pentatricopeptide repeat protein
MDAWGEVSDLLAPMWVEVSFMIFFSLGFLVLRLDLLRTRRSRSSKKAEESRTLRLHKTIEAELASGNQAAALKTWRAAKATAPTPIETLKLVAQALLEVQPDDVITAIIEHCATHIQTLGNARTTAALLDVVARSGRVAVMDELAEEFRSKLLIQPSIHTYEVLLGGHASAGDEQRVSQLREELVKSHLNMSARAHSLTIKGFLKKGLVDAALRQMQDMQKHGFTVPHFAVTQLIHSACLSGRTAEIFEVLAATSQFSSEGVVHLLDDCLKRNDMALALRVERHIKSSRTPMLVAAHDALLKLCVAQANNHALEVFQDMQAAGAKMSEGLFVGLFARSAESKFLRFAEELANSVRARHAMTIAIYSALMKVYAYCGLYDKACDLYTEIRAEGLEPDSTMYGCLLKFSVECGRTELSQELFDKAPSMEIHNYMSLIRAAGKDRDVDKAFSLLDKLKHSGVCLDVAAYNCVLDVCASHGDMQRARALVTEMHGGTTLPDIITYNTLLKGYCSQGALHLAAEVLLEIERVGLKPNDVSYNCLINSAVCSGNFKEAWNTIDIMDRNGVAVDHYTLSIMMKSLKKVRDPKDVGRALALLDRSEIDACSDEVLLNTVLEACMRHHKSQRLENLIEQFENSKLRPCVHTYGSLIKACSTLKWLDKCWELWNTMVHDSAMMPNDIVLGCMLDALVCNERVEEAVRLLNTWKGKIPPNTVMYSTLIKGFANSRQASRAMEMFREMSELGLTLNTVVFNSLIDSQARIGAMDQVSLLWESMSPSGCEPDKITYSTIVKGYCVKGDLEKAFEVFRGMQANKMAVDSIIYNTVMDGCIRHNRLDLVDLVLEDMEKYSIKPSNFTLGILVKMHGRRRQLDKAFQVIEELPRKYGLQLNSQVKTCLLCACITNGAVDRAMQVFDEMKAANDADAKAYGSLICGLTRMGQLQKAAAIVEDAYGLESSDSFTARRGLPKGQTLENEPLEQLFRALGNRRLMQSVGLPLLDRLRAINVPISGRLISMTTR